MYGLLEILDSSGCILAKDKQNFNIDIKDSQLYLSNFKTLTITRKGKPHGMVIRDPKTYSLMFSFIIETDIYSYIGEHISIYPVYAKVYPEGC